MFKDVSAEVFGKYQYCTEVDGKYYSDSDFNSFGRLKRGSLPSPFHAGEREPYEPIWILRVIKRFFRGRGA